MTGVRAPHSLIAQFEERARAAESVVTRASDWSAVAAYVRALGDAVAVAPSLLAQQPQLAATLGERLIAIDPAAVVRSVADAPAGIVSAVLAVAESGSVVLVDDGFADRAVAMLSQRLVVAVSERDVVESLDDVAAWIDGGEPYQYLSIVTGPSRTADIERSLTIGVQGPSELHVVLLP